MFYCLMFRFLLLVSLSVEEYFSCCIPPRPPEGNKLQPERRRGLNLCKILHDTSARFRGLKTDPFWFWWRVSSDVQSPLPGSGGVSQRSSDTFWGEQRKLLVKAKFPFLCEKKPSVIVRIFFTINPEYRPVALRTCLDTEPGPVWINPEEKTLIVYR